MRQREGMRLESAQTPPSCRLRSTPFVMTTQRIKREERNGNDYAIDEPEHYRLPGR